jgi:hypothetical protein
MKKVQRRKKKDQRRRLVRTGSACTPRFSTKEAPLPPLRDIESNANRRREAEEQMMEGGWGGG